MHYSPLAASPRQRRVDPWPPGESLRVSRLSGRFAVAPAGLVDSALNARHRRAAPVDALAPRRISARFAASPRRRRVDVAPLGEYMRVSRHLRAKGASMSRPSANTCAGGTWLKHRRHRLFVQARSRCLLCFDTCSACARLGETRKKKRTSPLWNLSSFFACQ